MLAVMRSDMRVDGLFVVCNEVSLDPAFICVFERCDRSFSVWRRSITITKLFIAIFARFIVHDNTQMLARVYSSR